MNTVQATIQDGRVVTSELLGWPGGTRLEIRPLDSLPEEGQMMEDSWPTTVEGNAQLVSRMDSREPLEWQPGEYEAWLTERDRNRHWAAENEEERSERLGEIGSDSSPVGALFRVRFPLV